jgi:hypothetical protein
MSHWKWFQLLCSTWDRGNEGSVGEEKQHPSSDHKHPRGSLGRKPPRANLNAGKDDDSSVVQSPHLRRQAEPVGEERAPGAAGRERASAGLPAATTSRRRRRAVGGAIRATRCLARPADQQPLRGQASTYRTRDGCDARRATAAARDGAAAFLSAAWR